MLCNKISTHIWSNFMRTNIGLSSVPCRYSTLEQFLFYRVSRNKDDTVACGSVRTDFFSGHNQNPLVSVTSYGPTTHTRFLGDVLQPKIKTKNNNKKLLDKCVQQVHSKCISQFIGISGVSGYIYLPIASHKQLFVLFLGIYIVQNDFFQAQPKPQLKQCWPEFSIILK